MKNIFDNSQQTAASKMQQDLQSEQTKKTFDMWYDTLPRWTEEEMQREAEDHLNENYHHSKKS